MDINLLPLGAGQEVGRSCLMINVGAVNIMLDCGIHLGHKDERRIPDFTVLGGPDKLNSELHAVVITHFHLDHIGALPYLTETLGYRGPIVMTHATKALAPLLLEDYHHICTSRGRDDAIYTLEHVSACLARVTGVDLHETCALPHGVNLTAYYAGHVLGAAMFHCRIGPADLLYTGDYNMVADRHLGAAKVPQLSPDVLITESTFATTVREARRVRERTLLDAVAVTVRKGGKVLIPVFALGNAQELSLLIDSFWRRNGLTVPIYMTEGMATKAAALFASLREWGAQRLRPASNEAPAAPAPPTPAFQLWRPELTHAPGPCVLFATPGMLHGGTSLRVFKEWAPNKDNLVLLPGYCTANTIGHMLMGGVKKDTGKVLHLDGQPLHVRCKVEYLAFSAHTDAKGIMDLVTHVGPRAVVLVHGEADKMAFLQRHIQATLNVPCYTPANGVPVALGVQSVLPVMMTEAAMRQALVRAGRDAATTAVQGVAKQGPDGLRALEKLLVNLENVGRGVRPGGGGAKACKHPDGLASANAGKRPREDDSGGAAAQACATAVLDRMRGAEAQRVCSELTGSCKLVAMQTASGQREMHLMTTGEAEEAGRATSGGAEGRASAERYVQFVADSVVKWMTGSGHGVVDVSGQGQMLQMGAVKARLIRAPGNRSDGGGSGHGPGPGAAEEVWMWEVLFPGGEADSEQALNLCDALVSIAGGT